MKKLVVLTISLLVMFILTACVTSLEKEPINVISDRNTLGILSYVSTSFLDETVAINPVAKMENMYLSMIVKSPVTSIESRLELINIYIDKLKYLIDEGTENFASIIEENSDRLEYEYLLKVIIDTDEYVLYYNEDLETHDISGLFIFDGIEYVIQAENSSFRSKDDIDEIKHHMILIARNGSDSIVVEYETKEEDNEMKQSFSILKNIDNVIDQLDFEIKTEGEDYILELTEDGNQYKFKLDGEEGNQAYKLDYIIDNVKGKVRIIESTNELGETIYMYRIQERSVKIDIEMEDPDNDDD